MELTRRGSGLDAAGGLPLGEYSGPEAAELAGITYRQLDYWARQRWVVPARVTADGPQRRVYTPVDVLRLAALGHLGRARVDVATYGALLGRLPLDGDDAVVVWSLHDERVLQVPAEDLRRVVSAAGRFVVFDPGPLRSSLRARPAPPAVRRPRRRTFTKAYKLAVLEVYDRLDEPGAKGAYLRREGLHTSHLVAWRRSRSAGALAPRAGSRRPPAADSAARTPTAESAARLA